MENFSYLLTGFGVALMPQNILAAIFGCVMGLLVGAMPGIGSLAGVALLLPLTFSFNPTTAIIMLGAVYYANMFGGAFSAILLNIPGDSPAVMTTLDGYPLAQKGRPGQALFTSNLSSFFGGMIGMVILVSTGPLLARFGLEFGPAELTLLYMVAMTSISWLMDDKNIAKGVVVTCIGMLLATMGMDAVTGVPRYTFGSMYILGGIPFISLAIGLVGFSGVIDLMAVRNRPVAVNATRLTIRGSFLNREEFRRMLPPALRAGFFGTFIGVLPGAGATTAAFMSYAMQKRFFKSEEPLGTGAIEGIASVESANNAAAAGAFAPLLALGIPGSGTGAVLLGGLMMWGLNPGPLLFTNNPDFAWGLIASLFIANILALLISFSVIPWIIRIIKVPVRIMIPVITVVCFVGAYSTSNSLYGVFVMMAAGFFGYVMKRYGYPTAPLILAYVLSKNFEVNMRRAFMISMGDLSIFVGSAISTVLLLAFIAMVLIPLLRNVAKKRGSGFEKSA